MATQTKKLIEVALPLAAINAAAAREKSIRHGHPSTLHLWWARRPLAAARAVIFAQMVDDPSAWPDLFPTEDAQEAERQRLFRIIEELVKWENTTNETVLDAARAEIRQSWQRTCQANAGHPRAAELFDPEHLPAFHDPFAGGGALPLEAQRLGLESHASDLNPVAVLINKAMIEIPPRFAGRAPVHALQNAQQTIGDSRRRGAHNIAEDVRHYGQWMRDEAQKRIGHLYPTIEVTAAMVQERPDLRHYLGQKLTVIAWLWARTVKSPNPAFANVDVPLASTFMLSTKSGKEAYVEPIMDGGDYRFSVKVGKPRNAEAAKLGTTAGKRAAFRCLMSDVPVPYDHIREEGKAGRMGARLMAIVAEGDRGRVYLSPTSEHEAAARQAQPEWKPDNDLPVNPRDFKTPNYGLTTFGDLFTPRQLVALTTFSDLVGEAIERIRRDALAAGWVDDPTPLAQGGTGAQAYAEAVGVYLALAVDKSADYNTTLVPWSPSRDQAKSTFARQALPMVWDYAEVNPIAKAAGDFIVSLEGGLRFLTNATFTVPGEAAQADAASQQISRHKVVSTDPPYYDNIGYADLSDFFYVWLRRSLRAVFVDLFATVGVPKAEELVATPYRHGGRESAERFFLAGMTQAMRRLAEQAHSALPVTIYYAFKQTETRLDEGTTNTGWDTFLEAVVEAGFAISGTWPLHTERDNRSISIDTNSLRNSTVIVCRPRSNNALTATLREFNQTLKRELPAALAHLQAGNIAPVDLAQAAIGPGMAVFTRYARVLDAEGAPISVRTALALINQVLDETLAEQEGDFDADTRWALAWFEQVGFEEDEFGLAEQLSKAKNTAISGLVEAGIVHAGKGKVRLLQPEELPADWDPRADKRVTVWEIVHHLVRVLNAGGESAAAELLARMGTSRDVARELCYRLYSICERARRAQDALAYNALVQSWPEIARLAQEAPAPAAASAGTGDMFDDSGPAR